MLIVIVAGEASGDKLGADLVKHLKPIFPQAEFAGVIGPQLAEQGVQAIGDIESLAVMGFVEPLKRLPSLLRLRRHIVQYCLKHQPAIYIGIDAPDFNLGIEKRLKKAGIKTTHYVSPSVWAWRQGRIKTIAKAVDHMLCLLPFEADFYHQHQVPATFIGHPFADDIPLEDQKEWGESTLGLLPSDDSRVCIMPGSRVGEIQRLADIFFDTAEQILHAKPKVTFLIPAANVKLYDMLVEILNSKSDALRAASILVHEQSYACIAASDTVLLASGTSTLECLLYARPMVVAYRVEKLTYEIAKRLVKIDYISLANLLTDKPWVNEYIQDDIQVETLANDVVALLNNPKRRADIQQAFLACHQQLQLNSSQRAASVIEGVINNC